MEIKVFKTENFTEVYELEEDDIIEILVNECKNKSKVKHYDKIDIKIIKEKPLNNIQIKIVKIINKD